MFDKIFGKYLVSKGFLSETALSKVSNDDRYAPVKLGMIAVSEKFLTSGQADEINRLQAITDKRFGDIAVEKGYLTEAQVSGLLKRQGNRFLKFVQALIDNGYFSLEEIDEKLALYQEETGFTHSEMDDLVSGDINRAVNAFMPVDNVIYSGLCGMATRTIIRLINSGAYIEKAYVTKELSVDRFASQTSLGDHKVVSGMACSGDGLLAVAVPFAKESFDTVDLDALDAVAEFVNCVDGLYATELSHEDVDIDMRPPEFFDTPVTLVGEEFCVLPIVLGESRVKFIVSVDNDIDVTL